MIYLGATLLFAKLHGVATMWYIDCELACFANVVVGEQEHILCHHQLVQSIHLEQWPEWSEGCSYIYSIDRRQ